MIDNIRLINIMAAIEPKQDQKTKGKKMKKTTCGIADVESGIYRALDGSTVTSYGGYDITADAYGRLQDGTEVRNPDYRVVCNRVEDKGYISFTA